MPDNDLSTDEPVLRLDRVGLSYGPKSDVLADVSLSLRPGSMTFLTGPSGSGKSTLLRLAYLALRPTAGRVSLFGVETNRLRRRDLAPLRRRIGVVFQEFRLLDHLSAYDNVALPLRITGRPEASYRQDVIDLLGWVGLGDRLEARPATLSGGEKQRVAIARALMTQPAVLLLDEPLAAVDRARRDRILPYILRIRRDLHVPLVYVTHDEAELNSIADRVIHLEAGRVVGRSAAP